MYVDGWIRGRNEWHKACQSESHVNEFTPAGPQPGPPPTDPTWVPCHCAHINAPHHSLIL